MASATYRVQIATRGATTVSGNVALTLALADLDSVPILQGPRVNLLQGSSASVESTIDCIVDDPLFVESGRLAVIGRLVEVQQDLDGAGWATIAQGRIKGASELGPKGRVTLIIVDERWVERDTEIFGTTGTVQLHPPGRESAFMGFAAAGTATYDVLEVSGDAVRIGATQISSPTQILQIPRSMRLALRDDVVAEAAIDHSDTNTAGNFELLRFDLVSGGPTPGDYRVISFASSLTLAVNARILLNDLRPGGDGVLQTAWIAFGSGHGLVQDDVITGRFYFDGAIRTRENVPLHIGGADGIHPMTLLKDILDGDYGGQPVLYDSTAMSTLEALPFQRVYLRIDEPQDRSSWLERNIYAPYAVAPLVGTDLKLRPTHLPVPQNQSLGGLATVTASSGPSSWEHTSDELANVIEFESADIQEISITADRGEDWPVDELSDDRQRDTFEHDNVATLGRARQRFQTDLQLAVPRPSGFGSSSFVTRVLSDVYFRLFGDGPQRGTIETPDTEGHQVGDLVLLEQDTLLGYNADTEDRSGDRLVRLITPRRITPVSTVFEYLDMGAGNVALSAPTVAVAQASDPDLIDVTVSGLGTGETAVIEATAASSPPSEYDHVLAGVGNETVQIRLDAPSGTAYVRAKAVAAGRIDSDWATDSVGLSTRARVNTVDVVRTTLTDFAVTWEVAVGTDAVRTDYSVHDRGAAPTFGSNVTDYEATDGGFSVAGAFDSTREMVTVRVTPYPTWTGSAASGTAGESVDATSIFVQVRASFDDPGPRVPEVEIVAQRARSIGASGGDQQFERDVMFKTNELCKSVQIEYSFVRPIKTANQPPPSTTFDVDYSVDVTPASLVQHVVEDGASAAQVFLIQNNAGSTIADGAVGLVVTPYSETGGSGGTGYAGQSQTVVFDELGASDDVGIRVLAGSQEFAGSRLIAGTGASLAITAAGEIEVSASGGGSAPAILKAKGTATSSVDDTEAAITWGAPVIDQLSSEVSISGSEITIDEAGVYKFTVTLSTDNANRTELFIRTYIDTGSGFVQDTDEIVSDYVSRDTDQNTGAVTLTTALDLDVDDIVEFRGFGDTDGTSVMLTAGTILLIEKY